MLIVAERINASRKAIRDALEAQDAEVIRAEARAQADAGADFIDVNGGTFPGREPELLSWLVETVQKVTSTPLCLDSSDPAAIAAALSKTGDAQVMINSITLERDRFDRVLPLALERRAKLVALCQSDEPVVSTAEARVDLARRLVDRLTAAGVAPDDIHVDPLVFPLAADPAAGGATLECIRRIHGEFGGVHTICGLTNISHGLPARRLVNRTFLVAAIVNGLDAAIVDPTDAPLMAALTAAETLIGRDEYCLGFIEAFRAGKLD